MRCPLCSEKLIKIKSKLMKDIVEEYFDSLVRNLSTEERRRIIYKIDINYENLLDEYCKWICLECGYFHDGIKGIKEIIKREI